MHASVIIRTRNEAARLRLTLASLAAQTEAAEIIVVDDASGDGTPAVVAAADDITPIRYLRHDAPQGRAGAAQAGADHAGGDILIFLDGDTLVAPDCVARHLAVHRAGGGLMARGETYHLRGTRWLADPATGSPMPGEEARVAALPRDELGEMKITATDISGNFASIHRRAREGIYPGAGPHRLYGLEMAALRAGLCGVLWAAAAGANQSVPAGAFRAAGGFDRRLTINEHRELALRLCGMGLAMVPAPGARSYHMIHRSGWRDPLADTAWETLFYQRHRLPEVALLAVLWGSLGAPGTVPFSARICSLPALEQAAARCAGITGIAAVRAAHFARAAEAGAAKAGAAEAGAAEAGAAAVAAA